MQTSYTLKELPEIAVKIIKNSKHKTLLFHGEMGSGKTTLIKEIIKQLGYDGNVSSPTFSIVNEYFANEKDLMYHFDFYRIEDEEEALAIGIEDYFNKNAWCFIEWPKNVENLLPLDSVEIHIEIINEQTRKLEIL